MSARIRTIYALCDPREPGFRIRYVGCTAQRLEHRIQAHLHEMLLFGTVTPKAEWLYELVLENTEPQAIVLEMVRGDGWEVRERYWIDKFSGPDLLNRSEGGLGFRAKEMPEEVRRKIAQAMAGRTQSAETRAKRKASLQGFKHSEESRARISEARRAMKGKQGPITAEAKAKIRSALAALIWITDGTHNRRIAKTEAIPNGWRPGRK